VDQEHTMTPTENKQEIQSIAKNTFFSG